MTDRPHTIDRNLTHRPVSRLLVGLIRLYQRTFSHWIGGHCRFLPTCSEYCIEAIVRKGAGRGLLKGAQRILRCHPLGGSGYDPVD